MGIGVLYWIGGLFTHVISYKLNTFALVHERWLLTHSIVSVCLVLILAMVISNVKKVEVGGEEE